jgi:hypothetical protein
MISQHQGSQMTEFEKNQTTGAFLVSALAKRADTAEPGSEAYTRYELGFGVYIKARSYAILNKIAFVLAFIACLSVVSWPIVLVFMGKDAWIGLVASTVTQTMITAVASFFILIYRHYKDRQTSAENLLLEQFHGK